MNIDLLMKLKEKATGGEWALSKTRIEINGVAGFHFSGNTNEQNKANAEYLLALHNSADALLAIAEESKKKDAEIKRLRESLEEKDDWLEHIRSYAPGVYSTALHKQLKAKSALEGGSHD